MPFTFKVVISESSFLSPVSRLGIVRFSSTPGFFLLAWLFLFDLEKVEDPELFPVRRLPHVSTGATEVRGKFFIPQRVAALDIGEIHFAGKNRLYHGTVDLQDQSG